MLTNSGSRTRVVRCQAPSWRAIRSIANIPSSSGEAGFFREREELGRGSLPEFGVIPPQLGLETRRSTGRCSRAIGWYWIEICSRSIARFNSPSSASLSILRARIVGLNTSMRSPPSRLAWHHGEFSIGEDVLLRA